MAGRNRKPLHLLAPSAFEKNRKRNEEMGRFNQADYPLLVIDEPPPRLAHDDIAQRYWREHAGFLIGKRVLTIADVTSLCTLCEVSAEIERDVHTVIKEGRTFMADDGVIRKHPLLAVISDNRTKQNQLTQQFGLTPASRTKAAPVPDDKIVKNAFAED